MVGTTLQDLSHQLIGERAGCQDKHLSSQPRVFIFKNLNFTCPPIREM